jgi:ParB family chromosome partitioning protein
MKQARVRGLGRGLEALIPLSDDGQSAVPQYVAVDQVRPAPHQVRRNFQPEPLRELADSIRAHGVLQPVLVRRLPDGYELIAGERRWRAARMAGLDRIPAMVRNDAEDVDRLLVGLIENLQRQNLDPIEEARGLKRLIDEFGLTHEEAAARVGKHRVAISQSLRLLNGSAAIQSSVSSGAISAGHARALVGLPTQEAQEQGLKGVLARNLSVRETETWVKSYRPAGPPRRSSRADNGLQEIASNLAAALGLPVSITGSPQGGRLAIRFAGGDDLDRLCAKLTS